MTKYFFSILLAALMMTAPAIAQTDNGLIECKVNSDEEAQGLTCDVRVGAPTGIRSISLLVNGEELEDARYVPFSQTAQTSAWLILIDRSNPARATTVRRNVEFAKQIAQNPRANQKFGIATFANDLSVIVDIGDRNANLERRLSDVVADGAATEFFATAIEGVKLLARTGAERRALVIMSDGKAEDTAYTRADLVSAAKAAGVVIYGMGFAEKASETPDLQILRRLVEDTSGVFVSVVGDDPIPDNFTQDFKAYLENGGLVEADVSNVYGDAEVNLTVALRDGSNLAATQNVFVQEAPIVEEALPLSWISNVYKNFDPLVDFASTWAEQNQGAAIALLVFVPLLFLTLIVLLLKRSRRANETEVTEVSEFNAEETIDGGTVPIAIDPEQELPPELAPVLGWFELVDDQDDRFEIREMTVQIGRHSECDFRLNNDSVHRHHAHFHFTSDMEPTITDLDTVNGVLVNEERINSKKLSSGDMIQLGEVRFRFFLE